MLWKGPVAREKQLPHAGSVADFHKQAALAQIPGVAPRRLDAVAVVLGIGSVCAADEVRVDKTQAACAVFALRLIRQLSEVSVVLQGRCAPHGTSGAGPEVRVLYAVFHAPADERLSRLAARRFAKSLGKGESGETFLHWRPLKG